MNGLAPKKMDWGLHATLLLLIASSVSFIFQRSIPDFIVYRRHLDETAHLCRTGLDRIPIYGLVGLPQVEACNQLVLSYLYRLTSFGFPLSRDQWGPPLDLSARIFLATLRAGQTDYVNHAYGIHLRT